MISGRQFTSQDDSKTANVGSGKRKYNIFHLKYVEDKYIRKGFLPGILIDLLLFSKNKPNINISISAFKQY